MASLSPWEIYRLADRALADFLELEELRSMVRPEHATSEDGLSVVELTERIERALESLRSRARDEDLEGTARRAQRG